MFKFDIEPRFCQRTKLPFFVCLAPCPFAAPNSGATHGTVRIAPFSIAVAPHTNRNGKNKAAILTAATAATVVSICCLVVASRCRRPVLSLMGWVKGWAKTQVETVGDFGGFPATWDGSRILSLSRFLRKKWQSPKLPANPT